METKERERSVEVIRFAARDGRPLVGEIVHPVGAAKANVIVHGATAVPRRYYAAFADHLAAAGYRVMTYDFRGVGDSATPDPRTDSATMSDWFEHDAPAAVNVLVRRDPALPLLAIGHSFGGQVAAALGGVPQPIAIATMGAQRGYWATFPWTQRPRMFLNWFVLLPMLTSTLGYLPGKAGLGEDMPSGVVRQWAEWCKSPRYFFDDHPELEIRIRAFGGRLLAMSVTDDAFAPRENIDWLIAQHRSASREHVRFTPKDASTKSFGHFGFFRRAATETVWPEVVGFLDESLAIGTRPRALGEEVTVRVSSPPVDESDVLGDLAHGRA